MKEQHTGIILFNKQQGETSFDCVERVKKLLRVKKVGHAGTLDPFATGLLILLVGKATRLQQQFMLMNKRYLATFKFGIETDTLDPTGKVMREETCHLELPEIEKHIKEHFLGEIEQRPPSFSAVKVAGKRAYSLSRQGITPKLPLKKVEVKEFNVLSVDKEKNEIEVDLLVSSGTYVRAIVRDLAYKMQTIGHVSKLSRETIGEFSLKDAVTLVDRKIEKEGENREKLLNALQKIEDCPFGETIIVDAAKEKLLSIAKQKNNFGAFRPYFGKEKQLKIISKKEKLLAVLTKQNDEKIACAYYNEPPKNFSVANNR